MTFEDLKDQGVVLPEEEWGRHKLETTVPRARFAAAFLATVGGWVIALLGGGGPVTWAGTVVFLIMLLVITWLCDRAVLRQRRRVERVRRELGPEAASARGDAGEVADGRR